jgi:tetratricopeptide (TPR) repeat protein
MTMTFRHKALLAGWLTLPLCAWAYHEGPGQELGRLDDAGDALGRARALRDAGSHAEAVEALDAALALLPESSVDARRRVRLEKAKAQMHAEALPEAHAELRSLVEPGADADLLDDARDAFANSQFYMTWLMRLEGQPRTEWEPEIDAARQTWRLIAERAEAAGDAERAARAHENLESAIRLARLEVKDLQGLPLPSQ